ncbi:hypothetical protein [Glycomyces harbinensis]|uniref:Uncharacterized protein n=1 Tax=Glycomyces harbinensis TaxID=58114 RepID=A0A1G6R586_9ACTN|nr:hypothetical protein [Glycomyces harbinensis]SDC99772.1 hypothetical protein SAMN05216270_101304 [Glycomyces harbinensis]
MRARLLGAAAVMAAAGLVPGAAAAEPAEEAVSDLGSAEAASPAGVGVGEDGMLTSDGSGPGFSVSRNADGDRIAVPLDAVDKVASGSLDLAEFNVDDPGWEPADPGLSGTAVTVTGEWLDGSAPDVLGVSWVDLDTGESGGPEYFEGATGTLDLEPGGYHLVAMLNDYLDEETYESVFAVQEVVVGDQPTATVVDGTKAVPVGFDLDRDVVADSVMFDAFSYAPGTQEGAWASMWAFPGGDVYAVPTGELSGGRDVGFVMRAGYMNPEGASEAYSYNLFRAGTDGIPGDMVETVHDEDLARLDAEYRTLGADSVFSRMDMAVHPVYDPYAFTSTGEIGLPSARTEFYTADEDLFWEQRGVFPYEEIATLSDWVYRDAGVLEPGSATAAVWNDAPVSVGLENWGQDFLPAMFYRWDEQELLYFSPWMFSTSSGDEAVQTEYLPGEMTLARDGTLVATSDEMGLAVEQSEVGAGRLKVTAAFDRETPWTPLGSRSAASWDFDYDPEANAALPVSVVEFAASGIANGYAQAGAVQDFTLEFAQQPGADDQDCAAMTFEVSFDDGATWTAVPIDREGDTATASVRLPQDAAFASVRFTAADAAGNTVEHETIRSYGIR